MLQRRRVPWEALHSVFGGILPTVEALQLRTQLEAATEDTSLPSRKSKDPVLGSEVPGPCSTIGMQQGG